MVFEALGVLMAATVQGVFVNSTRVAGDCAKNGEESSTVAPEQLDDEVFFFLLINNENLRLKSLLFVQSHLWLRIPKSSVYISAIF